MHQKNLYKIVYAAIVNQTVDVQKTNSFSNLPNPPSIALVRPEIFDVTIATLVATLALLSRQYLRLQLL